jgi:hypothetical protein
LQDGGIRGYGIDCRAEGQADHVKADMLTESRASCDKRHGRWVGLTAIFYCLQFYYKYLTLRASRASAKYTAQIPSSAHQSVIKRPVKRPLSAKSTYSLILLWYYRWYSSGSHRITSRLRLYGVDDFQYLLSTSMRLSALMSHEYLYMQVYTCSVPSLTKPGHGPKLVGIPQGQPMSI